MESLSMWLRFEFFGMIVNLSLIVVAISWILKEVGVRRLASWAALFVSAYFFSSGLSRVVIFILGITGE